MDDAFAIKDHARSSRRAVVIGGGLLGLESARALKYLGLDVTVIEFYKHLLPRQLDEDGADVLSKQIEKMGIRVILEATIDKLSGDKNVSGVCLKDGRSFECELVLISAGIRPNIKLAETANIQVNKGIIVNEFLEASVKDIFAIGDVVEFDGQIYGIIPAAVEQAEIVSGNVLDEGYSSYKGTVLSNILKVVDIDLASIGVVNPVGSGYEELKLKDEEKGFYKKIILKDNKVVGAILLGSKKDFVSINRLIKEKVDVVSIKSDLLKEKAVV
jgi:nitrite reductase (NADH) large subunit